MTICLNHIHIPIRIADTFQKKIKGLMGETNINYGMIFYECNAVHTFWMKESIDIIGLDENQKVIFIERNCESSKIIHIKREMKKTSILELPANTSLALHYGDTVQFTP